MSSKLQDLDQINTQRLISLDWSELKVLFTKWSDLYASKETYSKINERPVISILNLTDFTYYYGYEKLKLILFFARKIFKEKLNIDPFIIGLFSEVNARNILLANNLPIDAATGYALLPEWRGKPIQNYDELIKKRISEWYYVQEQLQIPFLPVASVGWDASVRGENIENIGTKSVFPWTPIITDVSIQSFSFFLDEAIKFNKCKHPEINTVFLHAWNEWTESSVIEPSDRFGFGFLEEIQKLTTIHAESNPNLIAYVYPGWHKSKYRPSVDEWNLLQNNFKPYFEGHLPPPKPLETMYDDSKIETSIHQINTASKFGLKAFTYFLYYLSGEFILSDPMNQTFEALSQMDSDFSVSLTWCLRLPHHSFPIGYPSPQSSQSNLKEQLLKRYITKIANSKSIQTKKNALLSEKVKNDDFDDLPIHELIKKIRK